MTTTTEAARGRRGTTITLAACVAAAMCDGMDVQAAGLAAAGISRALGPTPVQLGLFFAAANLGLAVGALFGGRLADRIGRKPVLTGSILAFGLCSLLTAASPDMPTLTLARLATGLGLGGAMPNLIALAADVTGERSRNAAIGLSYIGMPVGGGLASVLALALPAGAWRPLFVIGGVLPLLLGALIGRFLTTPARAERDAAAGPTAAAELFAQGRFTTTLALWLGFFAAALTLHLVLSWLPLLLQGRGLSKGAAAGAQIAFNLVGAAGALLAGAGLDGRLRPVSIALAIAAAPAALLALTQGPAALAWAALAAGLLGAGVLSQNVVLFGVAGGAYPEAIRGTALGAGVGASRLGALAGPSLAAALLSAGRSPAEVLTSLLPVAATAGACMLWLGWRTRAAAVAVGGAPARS